MTRSGRSLRIGRPAQGALIGLLSAGLGVALHATSRLDWVENASWDWRVRMLCRPGAATDQVRLILIDQKSLDWASATMKLSWPWPREIYSAVLGFCRRAGARAVVFDMLYTEPSPYPDDDRRFGESIAAAGNFVGAVFLGLEQGSATNRPLHIRAPVRAPRAGDGAAPAMPRATFPIPEVATNAAVLANVHGQIERDAVIRRIEPMLRFDGDAYPALGLAPLFLGNPRDVRLDRRELVVGSHRIPRDRRGQVILNYRGPTLTHTAFSAAAVVQSELRLLEGGKPTVDPAALAGRYVFFGVTAPGLLDLRPTPLSRVYPGVEIQATLLDNALSGDLIRDLPPASAVALILLFGLAAGVAGRCSTNAARTVLAFAVFLALPLLPGLAAYRAGVWVPVAGPLAASATALVAAVIVNYATEGRQKRFIKGAFRQYLSPAVIEELLRNPAQLRLGGEARELSIYFSDVRGFTGISEGLSPEDLTALLNEYLTAMTDVIHAHGGTIDKYEGDAIIAFWNAPLPQADHALRAVRAAVACQERLTEIRPALRERFGKELFARIGLNTGRVVVGNMGSHQRFDYTFLGDAGNLASRIEGINKVFGTAVLISEHTRERIGGEIPVREVSRVRVVGRAAPVRLFEPMTAGDHGARKPALDAFAAALARYHAGHFAESAAAFERLGPADPVAAAYARRCADLARNPPDAWDGVWVVTEK